MTKSLALTQLGEIRKYLLSIDNGGFAKLNAIQAIEIAISAIQTIKE